VQLELNVIATKGVVVHRNLRCLTIVLSLLAPSIPVQPQTNTSAPKETVHKEGGEEHQAHSVVGSPEVAFVGATLIDAATALAQDTGKAPAARPPEVQSSQPSAARVVDLKAPDGTILKASYFAAAKPGPGVLLLHQGNRTRHSWDDLAGMLAAAGINTLTLDMRGYGESGGKHQNWPREDTPVKKVWADDIDEAWKYLTSQPGVNGDVIGLGGAGLLGVDNSVLTARRHSTAVKSLVLLSGETLLAGQQFLRQASQLPGLFVVADEDEDPPTEEVMEWIYGVSSSPGKRLVHYAGKKAPWKGFEDTGTTAAGSHGTDLFKTHPELPGIIADWFVTTLIKTPGHAPAEPLASASIVNQIELPGGVAQVTQLLTKVRQKDPKAQLFPEVVVTIMGYNHIAAGETKLGVQIMKLVVNAYPDSADAYGSLSDAYLADGEKDLARQTAEKALALLDSHAAPASSWSDTEERRKLIRDGAQDNLKQLGAAR